MLDFGDCRGAVTGRLLPTGKVRDTVTIEGKTIEVSLVDAATPFVFVRAQDVGAKGTETPAEILAHASLMQRLEAVRGWAAQAMGLVDDPAQAAAQSPNIPRVMMVCSPQDYVTVSGDQVKAGDADVVVRQLAMQRPHKALAVVGSVCGAVASALEGSVVHHCKSGATAATTSEVTRLGHPSGVLQVRSRIERNADDELVIAQAQMERSARLIMQGTLYLSERRIAELHAQILQAKAS